MVSYRAALSHFPDPHELRSCGAADGELRRQTIPDRLHRVLAKRTDVAPRAPGASESQQMCEVVLMAKRDLQRCRVRLGTQRRVELTWHGRQPSYRVSMAVSDPQEGSARTGQHRPRLWSRWVTRPAIAGMLLRMLDDRYERPARVLVSIKSRDIRMRYRKNGRDSIRRLIRGSVVADHLLHRTSRARGGRGGVRVPRGS